MVWEWYGPEMKIKKNDKLDSYMKYRVTRERFDFFVLNFADPVIKPDVHITASQDLDIAASIPERRNGDLYIYDKVFLRADHIQIRWKPKISPSQG